MALLVMLKQRQHVWVLLQQLHWALLLLVVWCWPSSSAGEIRPVFVGVTRINIALEGFVRRDLGKGKGPGKDKKRTLASAVDAAVEKKLQKKMKAAEKEQAGDAEAEAHIVSILSTSKWSMMHR